MRWVFVIPSTTAYKAVCFSPEIISSPKIESYNRPRPKKFGPPRWPCISPGVAPCFLSCLRFRYLRSWSQIYQSEVRATEPSFLIRHLGWKVPYELWDKLFSAYWRSSTNLRKFWSNPDYQFPWRWQSWERATTYLSPKGPPLVTAKTNMPFSFNFISRPYSCIYASRSAAIQHPLQDSGASKTKRVRQGLAS